MKAPPSRDFIEDSELYGRTAASSAIQYPRPAPLQQQQQQPQRQQPQPQPQQPQQQFQQQQQQNQPQQQFQQRPPNNNIRMNPGPTHIPAPDSPDDMLLVADVECLDASILCRSPNRVQKPNFTPPKPIQQQQQQQPNASNFQFNNPPSLTMKKENGLFYFSNFRHFFDPFPNPQFLLKLHLQSQPPLDPICLLRFHHHNNHYRNLLDHLRTNNSWHNHLLINNKINLNNNNNLHMDSNNLHLPFIHFRHR